MNLNSDKNLLDYFKRKLVESSKIPFHGQKGMRIGKYLIEPLEGYWGTISHNDIEYPKVMERFVEIVREKGYNAEMRLNPSMVREKAAGNFPGTINNVIHAEELMIDLIVEIAEKANFTKAWALTKDNSGTREEYILMDVELETSKFLKIAEVLPFRNEARGFAVGSKTGILWAQS